VIVVDASALVDLLIRSPRGSRVQTALNGTAVAAPELIVVEVLSALHRLVRSSTLTAAQATAAADDFAALALRTVPHAPLAATVWGLRDRVRIADAFYVAAAQAVGVPLLTTDARLARAVLPGVTVTLVS